MAKIIAVIIAGLLCWLLIKKVKNILFLILIFVAIVAFVTYGIPFLRGFLQ